MHQRSLSGHLCCCSQNPQGGQEPERAPTKRRGTRTLRTTCMTALPAMMSGTSTAAGFALVG